MEIVDRGFRRVMETAHEWGLTRGTWDEWPDDGPLIDAVLVVEVIKQAKHLITQNGRNITDPETIRDPLQRLGWCWLERAERHEARVLDECFRGPIGGAPAPDPTIIIRSIAEGLETASGYLFEAAVRLKDRGDAHGASVTHQKHIEIGELWKAITEGADPEDPPHQADPPPVPIPDDDPDGVFTGSPDTRWLRTGKHPNPEPTPTPGSLNPSDVRESHD